MNKPKVTVIVANLGTPDEATIPAVRRFLKEFLSDRRVIEIPPILWQIILNAFVLPFRPKRVAHAYQMVWRTDSPMREIMLKQVENLQHTLTQRYADLDLNIVPAMTYGNPGLSNCLQQLPPQDHLLLLPLFPQYSATSSAPQYDILSKWMLQQRNLPGVSIIRDYYQHPLYIQALAESVRHFQQQHGQPEKLLMSFHGIPQPYADKGDPYAERCRRTAELLAEKLGLQSHQWAISFQSRFGKQEWVKPYTDVLLTEWGEQGVQSVQVISPAFSADCLETLEELALQNAEIFKQAGGQSYAYIPALNNDAAHLELLTSLLSAHLDAIQSTLAGVA
ncbi:MAG: ferrochelatase [Acinetobacter sp.]